MFGTDFWKILGIIKFIIELLLQVDTGELDNLTNDLKTKRNGNGSN